MHIIRQHIYTAKTIFFAVQISRYIPSYTSREVANKHTAIQLIAVIILTSSPRSKLNASCVLNVFSLAHFSQISSSVFAKSNAGGRLAMMLSQMAFQRHLLWRYYHQQLKICYQSQGGSLAVVLSCIEAFLVRYLIGRVRQATFSPEPPTQELPKCRFKLQLAQKFRQYFLFMYCLIFQLT